MRTRDRLRAWRKASGLSQEDAAKKAGVAQASWSNYESGLQTPGLEAAVRIQAVTLGWEGEEPIRVEDWGARRRRPRAPRPSTPPRAA
jgi:transcriptional regulator with XRE-family HTH domain